MKCGALARIEAQPESPFLPLDQIVADLKGWPFRLYDIQWFDIGAQWLRKKLGYILRRSAVLEDLLRMCPVR
jgi:hypothetical protein